MTFCTAFLPQTVSICCDAACLHFGGAERYRGDELTSDVASLLCRLSLLFRQRAPHIPSKSRYPPLTDMDFDSSLFDLPFEDLASLGIDTQQQSFAPGAIDFEDFCKDFATANDFDADVTDSQTPAWSSESASDTSNMAATAATTAIKSDDFLDSIDKSVFDCLEPVDGSSDSLFGSNMGSDAQVVPDMIPSTANVPEFSMPTFTQTSHLAPTQLAAGQGLPGRPYSWMNGMDYATFGWPARARLPSKLLNTIAPNG